MSPEGRLTLGQLAKQLEQRDHSAGRMVKRVAGQVGPHRPVSPEALEIINGGDGVGGKKTRASLFHLLTAGNGRPVSHCSHHDRGPKAHLYQGKPKCS